MRESNVERKLITEVKKRGGLAVKLTSPGFNGMPDRLVILPKGWIAFVEVKAPGLKPRPLQIKRHEMLSRLGCRVFVLDDEGQIFWLLADMMRGGDAT